MSKQLLFAAQKFDRRQADHQMLADGAVVEGVGGAGKLDLAMQRLVGHAEESAIGHPLAIALGRHGARFHVNGDGARQVDALFLSRPCLDRQRCIYLGHRE